MENVIMENVIIVNIYQRSGEWCYAAFGSDGFDSSDTVGCLDTASESEARADVAVMFPHASITRVSA